MEVSGCYGNFGPNVEEQGDEIYPNIGDVFPFKLVESISVIFDFPNADHEYEK